MLLFTAETPPITSPLIQIVIEQQKEEVEPQVIEKIYTIEEKIESNFYECDESIQYIRADDATCLAKPVYTPNTAQSPARGAVNGSSGLLTGSYGTVRHYGNCVNEPGVNSPRNGTNPISWPVLSRAPAIGATALWTYNHTGVVVGIYDNGDIEVNHQNYSGSRTRFSQSEMRGYR
jgi:hypothetical protein